MRNTFYILFFLLLALLLELLREKFNFKMTIIDLMVIPVSFTIDAGVIYTLFSREPAPVVQEFGQLSIFKKSFLYFSYTFLLLLSCCAIYYGYAQLFTFFSSVKGGAHGYSLMLMGLSLLLLLVVVPLKYLYQKYRS